eukprot:scaffold39474_cov33-Tisochrysis_lutea.AAC.2
MLTVDSSRFLDDARLISPLDPSTSNPMPLPMKAVLNTDIVGVSREECRILVGGCCRQSGCDCGYGGGD